MKFPPGYSREKLPGSKKGSAQTYIIKLCGKLCAVSRALGRKPGSVRQRLEIVLGIKKSQRSEEARIVGSSRIGAANARRFRNKIAEAKVSGKSMKRWQKKRTLEVIRQEERLLAIAQKFQNMGEYRK